MLFFKLGIASRREPWKDLPHRLQPGSMQMKDFKCSNTQDLDRISVTDTIHEGTTSLRKCVVMFDLIIGLTLSACRQVVLAAYMMVMTVVDDVIGSRHGCCYSATISAMTPEVAVQTLSLNW